MTITTPFGTEESVYALTSTVANLLNLDHWARSEVAEANFVTYTHYETGFVVVVGRGRDTGYFRVSPPGGVMRVETLATVAQVGSMLAVSGAPDVRWPK